MSLVDLFISIGIVIFSLTIGLKIRAEYKKHPLSETIRKNRTQLLKPYAKPKPICPRFCYQHQLEIDFSCPFQSIEQRREQETTKLKHDLHQE